MNVITILLDTLRRDFLGCYGNEWVETPNHTAFATRSIVFDQAYIGSFPCMPARRDIWTGRYEFPWRGWGPLEPSDVDFAGLLGAANRTSMLVSDHHHLWHRGSGNYHHNFSGVEFIRGQESDNWITDPSIPIEYPAAPHKLAGHARPGAMDNYTRNTAWRRHERDYFFPQVAERAADWLDRNHTLEDFCLFIDSFDPHEPWDPLQRYWEPYNPGYTGEQIIWPTYGRTDYLSADELTQIRALYAGKITMVDAWLGRFLEHVERLGLLQNTAVIITTDHGHMLGEHGIIGKPSSNIADSNLYQELAHVPMLVYLPDAAPGRRSELVQTVDLFPTILSALEIEIPTWTHGNDLLPLARGEGNAWPRDYAIWGRFGESAAITDSEWVLLKWPEGEANEPLYWYSMTPPEYAKYFDWVGEREGDRFPVRVARGDQPTALYHLTEDYGQQKNLARDRPDQVARLSTALAELLRRIDAPVEQLDRLGLSSTRRDHTA